MEFHGDSGLWLEPKDWKLHCSVADWLLIEKAATQTTTQEGQTLNDAERQRLVELSGPFWGRVLGQPESLTAEEKHTAKGWPSHDVMCSNLAEVTSNPTDPMTPEAFIEKAAAGAEWMTLAQTNLLDQCFNKLAEGQRRTQYSTQHFDRYRAGWLVATADEKRAYRNAQIRGQQLRRPGVPLNTAAFKEKIQTLTRIGNCAEDLQHQPLWMQDILWSPIWKYGFPICCTTDLYEYLSPRLPQLGEGRANVAPAVFATNSSRKISLACLEPLTRPLKH